MRMKNRECHCNINFIFFIVKRKFSAYYWYKIIARYSQRNVASATFAIFFLEFLLQWNIRSVIPYFFSSPSHRKDRSQGDRVNNVECIRRRRTSAAAYRKRTKTEFSWWFAWRCAWRRRYRNYRKDAANLAAVVNNNRHQREFAYC